MSRRALCALLLLAGCGPRAVRPAAPVLLRYAGAAAAPVAWDDELVLRGEVTYGGMPQLVVVRLRARIEERTVVPEGADGRSRVVQAWTLAPPEFDGLPVDAGLLPSRMEVDAWRAGDGETWTVSGTGGAPDGTLGWVLRTLGGFFPLLPPAAVTPGAGWSRTMTAGRDQAALDLGFTGRWDGFDAAAPGVALLTTGGTADLAAPAASAGGALTAFHLDHGGTVRFDTAAGAVLESRQSGTLKLAARSGKTAIGIRARFESVLTRAVPPARD